MIKTGMKETEDYKFSQNIKKSAATRHSIAGHPVSWLFL